MLRVAKYYDNEDHRSFGFAELNGNTLSIDLTMDNWASCGNVPMSDSSRVRLYGSMVEKIKNM